MFLSAVLIMRALSRRLLRGLYGGDDVFLNWSSKAFFNSSGRVVRILTHAVGVRISVEMPAPAWFALTRRSRTSLDGARMMRALQAAWRAVGQGLAAREAKLRSAFYEVWVAGLGLMPLRRRL